MKLFHKIFLCFMTLFGIAFLIVGGLLLDHAYENAIEQEKKYAFQEFQYNRYILQSLLYSRQDLFAVGQAATSKDFSEMTEHFSEPVAVYDGDKNCLFSNLTKEPISMELDGALDRQVSYQISREGMEGFIFVGDIVSFEDTNVYLVLECDISKLVLEQKKMFDYFLRLYLLVMCIGFLVIMFFSRLLSHPINRVSRAAERIASGDYGERIAVSGKDEIGMLASNFNHMAEKVEEKMGELSKTAQQKEDFTANFAHEIKTPLTSVIGFAEMLYQKDLPREQVKLAAEYILNEGTRLEALSLKLMELFGMGKENINAEKMSVQEVFAHIKQAILPICQKNAAVLHIDVEDSQIEIDYDLFLTLIFNLVDNSLKADCKDIWIQGGLEGEHYKLCLSDNGKGIPPDEVDRVTEAFYMVDKSRAREQHGAGLGMALVAKIAGLHKAELKIDSDGMTGTKVTLVFEKSRENGNEDKNG